MHLKKTNNPSPYLSLGTLALAVAMSVSPTALAGSHGEHDEHEHHDGHGHEHGSLDSHEHGVAMLQIAREGNEIQLNFRSPSVNIVGFEHRARSEEQASSVVSAQQTLEQAQSLFGFEGTACQPAMVNVDVSALTPEDKHHDDHDHDHDHGDQGTHSEVTASYQFTCDSGAALDALRIRLIDAFQGIEHLEVQWVSGSAQGAMEITGPDARLAF